jgi:hypothetical protein
MIVDVEFYNQSGFEKSDDVQALERALARAERLIDIVTFGKCRESGSLHEEAAKQLKTAICAQAEHYIIHGYVSSDDAIDCRVKIGDFSYESRNNGVIKNLSSVAEGILKVAGLLYAGTEVR